jgi:hypothetical protein
MATMPDVTQRPVVNANSRRMTSHDIVCVHTIVGFAPGGTAAHFTTSAAGAIVQCRDTTFRSVANAEGNHRVIAIENEDMGPRYGPWDTNDGHAVPGFTPEQCESIARICAWAHDAHGIPLELVPDSRPGRRGIAYHRQGINGNFAGYAFGGRVAGGERWSDARGKVCPGDRRINQLIGTIIPRARELADDEENEMNAAQNAALAELWQVVVSGEKRNAQLNVDLGFIIDELKAHLTLPAPPGPVGVVRGEPSLGSLINGSASAEATAEPAPQPVPEPVTVSRAVLEAAVVGAVGKDGKRARKILRLIDEELGRTVDA